MFYTTTTFIGRLGRQVHLRNSSTAMLEPIEEQSIQKHKALTKAKQNYV